MIALSIEFTNGRFHATPWGKHVNEAAPEWPPSPWRLVRAMIATWKRKLNDNPDCPSPTVESMLKKLSAVPEFYLPPASTGHSRHYMPWYKKNPTLGKNVKDDKKRYFVDRTLVFDGWVVTNIGDSVVVIWPEVILTGEEIKALETISRNINFFGRAESWADVRVLKDEEEFEVIKKINCRPADYHSERKGFDPVRVLIPEQINAFSNEHTPKIRKTEGRGKAKIVIETPLYDPDWHICMETLELHDKKWSDPPGSRWITYLRPSNCFSIRTQTAEKRPERERPTVARFAIDSNVLPLVEETLWIAEKARFVAMGCFRRVEEKRLYGGNVPDGVPRIKSEIFTGKDESGTPLEGHMHAFFLPTDEDGDGRLDHLTIYSEAGFGPSELKTIDRMRTIKRDNAEPLNLVLFLIGNKDNIRSSNIILGPSRVWKSATPFFATRHPKARGKKRDPPELLGSANQRHFVKKVLTEEINRFRVRNPEIPDPLEILPLNDDHRCSAHGLRPIQFKQFRQRKRNQGGFKPGGAFQIVFPEPVKGPIALGYGAHFGLGLFVPAEEQG